MACRIIAYYMKYAGLGSIEPLEINAIETFQQNTAVLILNKKHSERANLRLA